MIIVWDIVFGSLATLVGALGALLCRRFPRKLMWLSPLSTVVANVLIIPPVLVYAMGATDALSFIMLTVFIGEAVCAWLGGAALYYFILGTPHLRNLMK